MSSVKKIFGLLIIMFVFCFGVVTVNAETITLEQVVKSMEESDIFKLFNTDTTSCEISNTSDSLNIKCNYNEDGTLKTMNTNLAYANDVLSYNFTGDKNDPSSIQQSFYDALLISSLSYSVAKLNGYTDEQLESIDEDAANNYTLAENGLEMKSFDFEYSENGGTSSGTALESFKIDINNLKLVLKDSNNDKDKDNVDDGNNNVDIPLDEGPQTGANDFIIICVALLISCLFINNKLIKKTIIKRI